MPEFGVHSADRSAVGNPADVAQGYATTKIDQLENRRATPGVIHTLFGPSRQQASMSAALGPEAARVRAQLAREHTFGATHKAITGNSSTARQLVEMGGLTGAGAAVGLVAGGDVQSAGLGALAAPLARRVGGKAYNLARSGREAAVALEIARLLTGSRPVASLKDYYDWAPNVIRDSIARAAVLGVNQP